MYTLNNIIYAYMTEMPRDTRLALRKNLIDNKRYKYRRMIRALKKLDENVIIKKRLDRTPPFKVLGSE